MNDEPIPPEPEPSERDPLLDDYAAANRALNAVLVLAFFIPLAFVAWAACCIAYCPDDAGKMAALGPTVYGMVMMGLYWYAKMKVRRWE